MKTVSHIIHHMLFHFLSLWGYFNIFAKRKLDCCLYFINLLIWLKWLQANFKQAFPQGRDRRLWKERDKKEIIICVRRKRKWILISFLHIKFILLFVLCWDFFSPQLVMLDSAVKQKFLFGWKRCNFKLHTLIEMSNKPFQKLGSNFEYCFLRNDKYT